MPGFKPACCGGGGGTNIIDLGDVTVDVTATQFKPVDKCYIIDGEPTQFCSINIFDAETGEFTSAGVFLVNDDGTLTEYTGDLTGLEECSVTPEIEPPQPFIIKELCVVEDGVNIGEVVCVTVFDLETGETASTLFNYFDGQFTLFDGDPATVHECVCDEVIEAQAGESCDNPLFVEVCNQLAIDPKSTIFEIVDLCLVEDGINTGEIKGLTIIDPETFEVTTHYFNYFNGVWSPFIGEISDIAECVCDEVDNPDPVSNGGSCDDPLFVEICNQLQIDPFAVPDSMALIQVCVDGEPGYLQKLLSTDGTLTETFYTSAGQVTPASWVVGECVDSVFEPHIFVDDLCYIVDGSVAADVKAINTSQPDGTYSTQHFEVLAGALVPFTGDINLLDSCPQEVNDDPTRDDYVSNVCSVVDGVNVEHIVAINTPNQAGGWDVNYFTLINGHLEAFEGDVSTITECICEEETGLTINDTVTDIAASCDNNVTVVDPYQRTFDKCAYEKLCELVDAINNLDLGGGGGVANIDITGAADTSGFSTPPQEGDIVTYSYTVSNTGSIDLTNVQVSDPDVTISGGPIGLTSGVSDSVTFTGSYILTQADIQNGFVNVTSTVSGDTGTGTVTDSVSINVTIEQVSGIVLDKVADASSVTDPAVVGQTIDYSFTVSNTGNLNLSNVIVTDDTATVTGGPINLAPGTNDTATFTASYQITQADIDSGSVVNVASVSAGSVTGPVSSTDSETVPLNGAVLCLPNVIIQTYTYTAGDIINIPASCDPCGITPTWEQWDGTAYVAQLDPNGQAAGAPLAGQWRICCPDGCSDTNTPSTPIVIVVNSGTLRYQDLNVAVEPGTPAQDFLCWPCVTGSQRWQFRIDDPLADEENPANPVGDRTNSDPTSPEPVDEAWQDWSNVDGQECIDLIHTEEWLQGTEPDGDPLDTGDFFIYYVRVSCDEINWEPEIKVTITT